jgi:hypothetical protein
MNAPSLPQILDLAENVYSLLWRKKFYKIGPGLNVINVLRPLFTKAHNKLQCLYMTSLSSLV